MLGRSLTPLLLALGIQTLGASALAEMNPRLEPLKPLLGKTWRGTLPGSTPEKPVVDVSRFELALNGQAVRNLHSVNDGVYGGETLFYWDQEKQSVVSHYFTTAGFYTVGTMTVEDGALVFNEVVKGEVEGITEVRARSRLLTDGRLRVSSQYLKNGQWTPVNETEYVEDPSAVVRLTMAPGPPAPAPPAPAPGLLAPLQWFAGLAEACWTGKDAAGTVTDRQCYRVQYDRYLRGTIEIKPGSATGKPAYEGEGLFAWDAGKARVTYFYWASAGHFGQAEGYFEGDRLVFPPASEGKPEAPPVRSVWRRIDESSFEVVREKKDAETWKPVLTVVYRRD